MKKKLFLIITHISLFLIAMEEQPGQMIELDVLPSSRNTLSLITPEGINLINHVNNIHPDENNVTLYARIRNLFVRQPEVQLTQEERDQARKEVMKNYIKNCDFIRTTMQFNNYSTLLEHQEDRAEYLELAKATLARSKTIFMENTVAWRRFFLPLFLGITALGLTWDSAHQILPWEIRTGLSVTICAGILIHGARTLDPSYAEVRYYQSLAIVNYLQERQTPNNQNQNN